MIHILFVGIFLVDLPLEVSPVFSREGHIFSHDVHVYLRTCFLLALEVLNRLSLRI